MPITTDIQTLHPNLPVKESLRWMIYQANDHTWSTDTFIFSKASPVAGTWRDEVTDNDTALRLTAKEEASIKGTIVVTYNRLKLEDLNVLLPLKVKAYQPSTTHDLLKPIFYKFGILLEDEEIIDEPLVAVEQVDPEADPIYTLRAVDGALGWTGSCEVQVTPGNALLRDYLLTQKLPGLNYPNNDNGANGSALVYMYGYDFTDHKDILETYPEDLVLDEFSTEFLELIKLVDKGDGKDLWNLDPESTAWSLHGAEIVYAGINSASLPTNTSYKYVLGIKLRDDVTTPPGTMYLHYNDPLDTSVV